MLKLDGFGASGRDARVLDGLRRVRMNGRWGVRRCDYAARRSVLVHWLRGSTSDASVTRWQVSSATDNFRYNGVTPRAYSVHSWTMGGAIMWPPWGGRPA